MSNSPAAFLESHVRTVASPFVPPVLSDQPSLKAHNHLPTENSLSPCSTSSRPPAPPLGPSSTKPISALLADFQHRFAREIQGMSPLDPRFQALLDSYTQLQLIANVERIQEACDHAAQSRFLPALIRELNKAQSLQQRALARVNRDKAAREKELKSLEREKERTARYEKKERDAQARFERKMLLAERELEKMDKAIARHARADANTKYRNAKSPAEREALIAEASGSEQRCA